MRELVGSVGMLGLVGTKYHKAANSADGRKYRQRFAETFIAMVNYEEAEWQFSDQRTAEVETLRGWFGRLDELGLMSALQGASRALVKIRNGFDHAWTGVSAPADTSVLKENGMTVLGQLESVVRKLP